MNLTKRRRWSERTRMLLTLQLAVVLPAAALIGASIFNLRDIQRSRGVEATIQRDFMQTLRIAEKQVVKRAFKLVEEARAKFPCPEDSVAQTLDTILEANPHFAHVFFYEPEKGLTVRSQARRMMEPDFRAEADRFAESLKWMKLEAKMMAERLRQMEKKDSLPAWFYANPTERGGKPAYQNFAVMTLPKWPAGSAVLGGAVFDAEYLREQFFPGLLDSILTTDQGGRNSNAVVMMVHVKKESSSLAASSGWDGGSPEVERPFEMAFPGLVLAIKFRGTTIEAMSNQFLRTNFLIVGGLSVFLAFGVWLTYRSVSQEMALARLKADFVANVSHELRTPLALIRLYAETLEMGRLTNPEKPQEYYRIIREESERLTALINNILDFSRIEAGKKEYTFHETNLAELVRSTLDAYRYQIEQNGFAFESHIAEDLPPVHVDREAIARSLLNLINNAVKYSDAEKFLGVNVYRTNGTVKVEVVDHGIGIPRGEQSKIFEKFYRAGDPLVHNTKGSGLGLSLVRHIVQAHGGNVSVDSTPGKGSKFTIALPVSPGGAEVQAA